MYDEVRYRHTGAQKSNNIVKNVISCVNYFDETFRSYNNIIILVVYSVKVLTTYNLI